LRRALACLVLLLLVAGCGGGDDGSQPAAATATPTPTPSAARGEQLPERPQVDLAGADLPAFRAGRAAAPEAVDGPASVVGTIRDPQRLRGRAGVHCRGYELTVDRRGRARVERAADGRSVVTFRARIDAASPPGRPLPLVLVCGPGEGTGVVLGATVGARALTYVRDDGPLEGRQAGLVARSRADQRRFAALQLYLAE
jgi:hypothetical protein